MMNRDWSSIPADIQGLISSRLSSSDALSFRSVFSFPKPFPLLLFLTEEESKRKRKKQRCSNGGRSQFDKPIKQVLPTDVGTKKSNYNVWFYGINEDKAHRVDNIPYPCNHLISAGPDGWLVMLDRDKSAYLLKLMPQIQPIKLPQTLGHEHPRMFYRKSIVVVRDQCNLIVVALVAFYFIGRPCIAFWRHADKCWTLLPDQEDSCGVTYADIAFCQNTHTLYALRIVGRFHQVWVEAWDFTSPLFHKKLGIQVSGICNDNCYYYVTRLVVHPITCRILLIAYRGKHEDDDLSLRKHEDDLNLRWLIYNVDLSQGRGIQLYSLNGEALLLGKTSSIFVSSNHVQHHGYHPNSIYFMNWWHIESEIKFCNYSIEDEQLQVIWDSPGTRSSGFSWILLPISNRKNTIAPHQSSTI